MLQIKNLMVSIQYLLQVCFRLIFAHLPYFLKFLVSFQELFLSACFQSQLQLQELEHFQFEEVSC